MAYPEPIPAIKSKNAKQFAGRLETFKLTPKQKSMYKNSRQIYKKLKPKEQ